MKKKFNTKQLVYSAVAIAIATVCSMMKSYELPFGGSITLFSMLFIVLIGYWFGLAAGLVAGVAYGLLQFVLEPIFFSFPQMLLDYPLAFGALGLSGLFSNKKRGLVIGYLVGVAGRFFCSFLSGCVFFADYAPAQTPQAIITYSFTYQASYIVPEAVLTLVILMLPPVSKALAHVKKQAA